MKMHTSMTFRFLPLSTHSGFENMAIDEAILEARIQEEVPNTLRFYKWEPSTATIGKHQSLHAEIDLEQARRSGVDVVRRISGGGAVLHAAETEITYSIVVRESDLKALRGVSSVSGISHLLARGLRLGVQKYGTRPEEGVIHCPAIFLDGKKISGNAQARRRGTILQHGTLLLDVDPEFMYSILKAPTGVPKTRMVQSVRAKVTGLRQHFPDLEERRLIQYLVEGFQEALGVQFEAGELTSAEMKRVRELAASRYRKEEWLKKYE